MRRRDFLGVLGGATVEWPTVARAADNAAGDRVSSQRIGFTLTGAVAVWPLAARAQQPDGMWPYRQSCARSFQFGRASAPIAPQIVQTMRGPKEGTVMPSAKPLTSSVAW
jgi:hypothetical protein